MAAVSLAAACYPYQDATCSYPELTATVQTITPASSPTPFPLGAEVRIVRQPALMLYDNDTTMQFERSDSSAYAIPQRGPGIWGLWSQVGCDVQSPCFYGDYTGSWRIVEEQEAEFPNATVEMATDAGTVLLYPDGVEVAIELSIVSDD